MRSVCIGDIHGCGLELHTLLTSINLDATKDRLILVGDLFDRAEHGHFVWNIIKTFNKNCFCLLGNHERKMLQWLKGKRDSLPPHYYWAINNLYHFGVKKDELIAFLEELPTLLWLDSTKNFEITPFYENTTYDWKNAPPIFPEDIIIVHAGINVNNILDPNPKYTVYGDMKPTAWWDRYRGENLVIYGHLSDQNNMVRIRSYLGDFKNNSAPTINSIGLDTAAVHGGYLTGYILETKELIDIKVEKNYHAELKKKMPEYNPLTGMEIS